jgi:hypothetical protein
MREIRFRAWFKPAKYMFKHEDLYIYNFRLFSEKDSQHILMQYTGLKDKNGKEIYEGDIVKCVRLFENYEVQYYNACFICKNGISGFDLRESENIEVIGNIYENPELLKYG